MLLLWVIVSNVLSDHHYANDNGETITAVYKAGMDSNCGSFISANALGAVQSGELAVEDMQASLYRLALVQFRLGLFDEPTDIPWV